MVHITGLFSNFPKPLERLIAKLGEQPGGTGNAPRKNIVHKVSSAKQERRAYKPNRRLSPDEVQQLVAKYEAGVSLTELAQGFGMHPQTVNAHLKRQGVQKRGAFKLTHHQVQEAVKLYGSGWSTIEIAKKFNISTNAARLSLIRAGVTLRSSHEGRWQTKKSSTRGSR